MLSTTHHSLCSFGRIHDCRLHLLTFQCGIGGVWVAPVIAHSTFLLGAAYVHIQDILINDNLNPGNAGPILFYDIAIPMLACSLLFAHHLYGGLEDA